MGEGDQGDQEKAWKGEMTFILRNMLLCCIVKKYNPFL